MFSNETYYSPESKEDADPALSDLLNAVRKWEMRAIKWLDTPSESWGDSVF